MLAHAFTKSFSDLDGICIYAAGVSNSRCTDEREFARERIRLEEALRNDLAADAFVYFGTCSVYDESVRYTAYVRHKLEMESLVGSHPRYLIVRLPQVAGRTPNPNTLLNFLYSRIARSERFSLWLGARRNIIDVDDVAAVVRQIVLNPSARNIFYDVANVISYSLEEIVGSISEIVGKPAIYDAVNAGTAYDIDTSHTSEYVERADVVFGPFYLKQTLSKYYRR